MPRRSEGHHCSDVSLLPRDPRGEGLHSRPRTSTTGDARAQQPRPRMAGTGGARGARSVPGLQRLFERLPYGSGHGLLQGRGPAPVLPRPPTTPFALHPGQAPTVGRPGSAGTWGGQRSDVVQASQSGGSLGGRRGQPSRPAALRRTDLPTVVELPTAIESAGTTPLLGRTPAPGRFVGRLVHRPLRPAGGHRRRQGIAARRLPRGGAAGGG